MKKLTREQKISNLKKAFIEYNNGKGYQHFFKDKKQGDCKKDPSNTEYNDYAIVSYLDDDFKGKKQFRIIAGKEETKRTSDNKLRTKHEPLNWYLNTEDAENLICFLEAFIEVENQKEVTE